MRLIVVRLTRGRVDRNDGRAELFHSGLLYAKTLRKAGTKPLEDGTFFHADNALDRARHAEIADVGGPAGEDLLVGRLHVRVRPDDAGDAPVQIAADGDLLGGRLGMKVHHDDRRARVQLAEQLVGAAKRIVNRGHEGPSHKVEHADGYPVGHKGAGAASGERRRIVGRANHAIAVLQVFAELALIKRVISSGDEVDAAGKHLLGRSQRSSQIRPRHSRRWRCRHGCGAALEATRRNA